MWTICFPFNIEVPLICTIMEREPVSELDLEFKHKFDHFDD